LIALVPDKQVGEKKAKYKVSKKPIKKAAVRNNWRHFLFDGKHGTRRQVHTEQLNTYHSSFILHHSSFILSMNLTDTHCHLDYNKFDPDARK